MQHTYPHLGDLWPDHGSNLVYIVHNDSLQCYVDTHHSDHRRYVQSLPIGPDQNDILLSVRDNCNLNDHFSIFRHLGYFCQTANAIYDSPYAPESRCT